MKRDDTAAIIRQSEAEDNASLRWSAGAVERVWHWTQGHPYFTQLLCSEVWETAMEHDDFSEDTPPLPLPEGEGNIPPSPAERGPGGEVPPIVQPEQVDAAVDGAIEQGANALQWVWNGLPPAERIVMAAMAEAEGEEISRDTLADILNRSKVYLILRDLDLAPETLIAWDLLRPVGPEVYRFAVPLLRRWVADEKPLRRVKANLDSLEPLAESLYQSAEGFSKIGNVDEAERLLRNALDVNPYHFRARLLLGKVLLAQGRPNAAVEELKPAYDFDARSSKSQFITALLAAADGPTDDNDDQRRQLALYEQILSIDPHQPDALKKRAGLKRRQASALLQSGELDRALGIYEEIGDREGAARVAALKRRQASAQRLSVAERYEASEDWNAAIALYQQLLAEFPDDGTWRERLETAQVQQHLADLYARGLAALNQGRRAEAQELFGEILGLEPTYKDAWRCLGMAAKGIDVNELLHRQDETVRALDELKHTTAPRPSRLLLGFLIVVWFAFLVIGGRALYDLGYDRGRAHERLNMATPTPPTPAMTATPEPTPPAAETPVNATEFDPLTGMTFVKIPPGCFQMGCEPDSEEC
jgi:tetratricopeptide (TPR) repeat protein